MEIYRRCGLFILLISCFCSVSAQQKIRLNDNWEFLRQDLGSAWETVRPVPKDDAPEAVPIWQHVVLPHCVNAEDAVDPDGNYYQGPAWYRTRLSIQNPYSNGRTFLQFEGAGQKTDIYIYTMLVGSHVGGYDEFTIDITDAVDSFRKTAAFQKQFKGTIPLSIRTDNSRDVQRMPSGLSDFTIYGGIYRYLNLVYLPSLSINKLFVSSETDSTAKTGTLIIQPIFYNPAGVSNAVMMIQIFDPAGKLIRQTEEQHITNRDEVITKLTIPEPQLWSPDHPVLYTVEASIGEYKYTERFAFRNIEFVSKGPFMLNGKRLLLRGTHRHEDHAGVGAALTEDMMLEEMIMIKQMGVNFIRLGHYQQSRIILDLCDSLEVSGEKNIKNRAGGC